MSRVLTTACVAAAVVLATLTGHTQAPRPTTLAGRSTVYAPNGVIATSQPLATSAGLAVLQRGGNAIDAAVVAAAVLTVVEPNMTGVGGDLFAMVWSARDRTLHGLNASGRSGSLMTRETLAARGRTRVGQGIEAVTIPGSLSGMVGAAREVRHADARRSPGAGDRDRRNGISGHADHRIAVGGRRRTVAPRRRRPRSPAHRRAARAEGRGVGSDAGPRTHIPGDRGTGARAPLRRRAGPPGGGLRSGEGRLPHSRRLRRACRRLGAADQRALRRLPAVGAAAEQPGRGGAGDAPAARAVRT